MFYDELQNNLKISLMKSEVPRISVVLTSHEPAQGASLINDYLIPLAIQQVIDDEEHSITAELNREKAKLMGEIQVIEQRYINANLNRQNQLKQAIAMAEAGSITKPQLNNISGNDSPQYLFLPRYRYATRRTDSDPDYPQSVPQHQQHGTIQQQDSIDARCC